MTQRRIPAVFMRGGTSKGLFFHERDLPPGREARDSLFLSAIGSPDPYARQLDGMGGGISSLSKVVVIGPPSHPEADVDYTFGQVAVREPVVDYRSTCGNLTSAVGPFAIDEGLVAAQGNEAAVRIHNTNTRKLIVARFPLNGSEAAVDGEFALAGVAGTGAPIRLEFRDPGGAATGRLLPTGRPADDLQVPGEGAVRVSMVDATNPCAFVDAAAVGLDGTESPERIENDSALMDRLEAIRCAAGVAMGLGGSPEEIARESRSSPKIAVVAPPRESRTLSGEKISVGEMDISVRMLSMGVPHRAVPLTGAMCLAVASAIDGSVPSAMLREGRGAGDDLRIGTPSGVMPVGARVQNGPEWRAEHVVVYRTARRLMEGSVLVHDHRGRKDRNG